MDLYPVLSVQGWGHLCAVWVDVAARVVLRRLKVKLCLPFCLASLEVSESSYCAEVWVSVEQTGLESEGPEFIPGY